MRRLSVPAFVFLLFAFAPPATFASDPLKKVARQLVHDLKKSTKPRVGLLSFSYSDERESPGTTIVPERLTTLLVEQKKIRVIERHLLKKILEEQHLSETGVIDGSSAKELGKVLGVDILVTGTLQDLPDHQTQVNARAIEVQSGEVVSAAEVTIEKTWTDRPRPPQVASPPEPQDPPRPNNDAIELGPPVDRPAPRPAPRWRPRYYEP